MRETRHELHRIWQAEIVNRHRRERFLVLVSFLVTFGIVRFITHAIKGHWFGFIHNVQTSGGLHIHHMVWGIILVLIAGYLAIDFPGRRFHPYLAVTFGVGAALILDEFALILNLKDVYWSHQGRESVDAVFLAAGAFLLIWVGSGLWPELGKLLGKRVRLRRKGEKTLR